MPLSRLTIAIAFCFSLGSSVVARAEATVTVEVKTKSGEVTDGVVTLEKGDAKHSCTTKEGRCQIGGVSGGLYWVDLKIEGRPSPKRKQVMIPPNGEARLVVNAD